MFEFSSSSWDFIGDRFLALKVCSGVPLESANIASELWKLRMFLYLPLVAPMLLDL